METLDTVAAETVEPGETIGYEGSTYTVKNKTEGRDRDGQDYILLDVDCLDLDGYEELILEPDERVDILGYMAVE